MTTTTIDDVGRGAVRALTGPWWLFLLTGIAWVIISFMVLAFDPDSVTIIGLLTGFVLLAAGINELVWMGFATTWRWAHVLVGILFIVAGVLALFSPMETFGILALLIGWYLL